MKPDIITAAFFSPTGGTGNVSAAIADGIADRFDMAPCRLDLTLPEARTGDLEFAAGDLVVFGLPTYAGRIPNVLLPWLTAQIHGGGALALPVVTYGNRNYDDSLIELRDLLEAAGFHTIGGAAFSCEHSFSRVLGRGRPDSADMEAAEAFSEIIADRIKALDRPPTEPAAVAGHSPIRPYYTPRDRAGEPINILKVKPLVDPDKCVNCGTCARVCPMGSIDPADINIYTGICIKCGACTKRCPAGARYYDDPGYLYHLSELEQQYAGIRRAPELF